MMKQTKLFLIKLCIQPNSITVSKKIKQVPHKFKTLRWLLSNTPYPWYMLSASKNNDLCSYDLHIVGTSMPYRIQLELIWNNIMYSGRWTVIFKHHKLNGTLSMKLLLLYQKIYNDEY